MNSKCRTRKKGLEFDGMPDDEARIKHKTMKNK